MIWFEYVEKTPKQIFDSIAYISLENINSIIIMVTVSFLVVVIINYILPAINISKTFLRDEKIKKKKKDFIKQIAFQKELEDEIAKSLWTIYKKI